MLQPMLHLLRAALHTSQGINTFTNQDSLEIYFLSEICLLPSGVARE